MEKWQERPEASTSTTPSDEMTSVGFAEAARRINRAAASAGLTTPAFRSPPRQPGLQRSITRRSDGSATVSVALRSRPPAAVVADMIDGVLAANRSASEEGSPGLRDRLWAAATPCLIPASSADTATATRRVRPARSRSRVDQAAVHRPERPAA